MIYREPKPVAEGWMRCKACGGTGRIPRPRESWEAPIYGDDTVTCPDCRSLGSVPPPPSASPDRKEQP